MNLFNNQQTDDINPCVSPQEQNKNNLMDGEELKEQNKDVVCYLKIKFSDNQNIKLEIKSNKTIQYIKAQIMSRLEGLKLKSQNQEIDKLQYNDFDIPDWWTLKLLKEEHPNAFKNLSVTIRQRPVVTDKKCCWIFSPGKDAALFTLVGLIIGALSGAELGQKFNSDFIGILTFVSFLILGYVIGAALDNNKCPCCTTGNHETPVINERTMLINH